MSGLAAVAPVPKRTAAQCGILRAYTALARGEHRVDYPYTDDDFLRDHVRVWNGGEPMKVLTVWSESADLRQAFARKWGARGLAKIDERRIFAKPSVLANRLYCEKLRKAFGAELLDGMPEFEKGLFRLPKGRGFFVPQYDDRGRMVELKFYEEKILK